LKGDDMKFRVYRRLGTVEIEDQMLVTVWVHLPLTPHNRVLLEKLIVAQLLKKPPHFIESKGSSPCSQGPVAGPSWSALCRARIFRSSFFKIDFSVILPFFTRTSKCSLFYAFFYFPMRDTCPPLIILAMILSS
jgi:hypothetical protein